MTTRTESMAGSLGACRGNPPSIAWRAEAGRLRRRRSLEYRQYSALRCSLHPARLRSATLGPCYRDRLLAGIALALVMGCSGEPTARDDRLGLPGWSGGSGGSGGSAGSNSEVASGGVAETSVANDSGGAANTGNLPAVGGDNVAGGGIQTGGYVRSGGVPGTGGAAGSGTPSSSVPISAGGATSGGTAESSNTKAAAGGIGAGGAAATGGSSDTGGSTSAFDWGTATYNASGGASVTYQGHYTGQSCIDATCHKHKISLGGTVYQANGTSTASNVQIGIRMNGALTTTYAGKQGNFFANLSAPSWDTAQIAIRTDAGTRVMPANATASGNCNGCHSASNRIVTP
jgi:hypothetical protein